VAARRQFSPSQTFSGETLPRGPFPGKRGGEGPAGAPHRDSACGVPGLSRPILPSEASERPRASGWPRVRSRADAERNQTILGDGAPIYANSSDSFPSFLGKLARIVHWRGKIAQNRMSEANSLEGFPRLFEPFGENKPKKYFFGSGVFSQISSGRPKEVMRRGLSRRRTPPSSMMAERWQ